MTDIQPISDPPTFLTLPLLECCSYLTQYDLCERCGKTINDDRDPNTKTERTYCFKVLAHQNQWLRVCGACYAELDTKEHAEIKKIEQRLEDLKLRVIQSVASNEDLSTWAVREAIKAIEEWQKELVPVTLEAKPA